MTNDETRLEEPLEPKVVAAVGALYEPPGGDAYWPALEARIRARLAAPVRWWQVVGGWGRSGLVAAAAVIVAALVGALMLRAHAAEVRTAYESVTRPVPAESIAVPAGALSERDGPDQRGATFRDVISH